MRNLFIRLAAVGILWAVAAIAAAPAFSQGEAVNWSQPETIDPFQPGIGDFLDVDIAAYRKQAREAYDSGEYEEAAKYYLALLRYNISDSDSIYNLASCYGLLGKAELAAKFLERAVKAGFSDFEHIKRDPDFDKVRGSEAFDAVIESLEAQAAEKAKKLGTTTYFMSPTLLKSRVQLPENYDATKSYSLIVGLHGYGSNPDRFITLWERFADRDFIYASPQAPYAFRVGNDLGYSWDTWAENDENVWKLASEMSGNYIVEVVRGMREKYSIDRVYLLGFSQGAAYAYMVGIRNHDVFDGLMSFGGWLNADWIGEDALTAGKDLRVFIAHGNKDKVVDFEKGVQSRDKLAELGYDVTFFEFDGAHRVPEESVRAAEDWMKG